MRTPPLRSDAGFTLLELLVSLAILAIVLSFLPGTLRLGQRVWEGDARFLRQEGAAAFERAVEQRLSQAMPVFIRDTGGVRIDFEGRPDRVEFIAPSATGPAGGGVYRFSLAAEGGQALKLRQTLYRPASTDAAALPATDHIAPTKVRALSLRYFGQARLEEAAGWQTEWPRRDALPELVEITIRQCRGEEAQRIVVPLRLRPSS